MWYIRVVLLSTTIKPAITALTRKEMLYCLPGFCQELFTMRRAVMRVSKMSIGLDQGRAGMRGNTALMRINLDFIKHVIGKPDITNIFDK